MPRRPPATLADYLVVAICPTLIGLLVGSLLWFLIEVFYQGDFKLKMLWVLTMFTVAIVGIARISMERGLGYASLFALPLAGAVALHIPPIGWPLIGLVWWATHQLTWDSTLMDDSQDTSGQGLLQHMGLEPSADAAATSVPEPEGTTSTDESAPPPWWHRFLEADRRPHAPGVWVVYFSLAALPLFGIGGWFATDPVSRAHAFGLLVIYVASGMGLLLATSFLGLRRYLRQRNLEMPLDMTSTWIVVGVVMICAMLLVAAILPRPSREQSLSALPSAAASAARRASRYAFLKEGVKDDVAKDPATTDAKGGQETDRQGGSRGKNENAKSASKTGDGKADGDSKDAKSGSSGGKSSKGGKQSGQQKSGDESKRDAEKSGERNRSAEAPSPPPDAPPPDQQPPPPNRASPSRVVSQLTSSITQSLGPLLRWLFYAALLIGIVVAAFFYREELLAAWRKLLDELRDLWESWFGRKPPAAEAAIAEVVAPPRTFASYPDPFLTGDASRMSWQQLVRYTFEALEAWGREHNAPRATGQTAHEFAVGLAAVEPQIGNQANQLANWYSQLAYAPRAPVKGSPESLRDLWANLASNSAAPQRV